MEERPDYSNLLALAKDQIDKVSTQAKHKISMLYKEKQWSGGYYDLCTILDRFQADLIEVIVLVLKEDVDDGK